MAGSLFADAAASVHAQAGSGVSSTLILLVVLLFVLTVKAYAMRSTVAFVNGEQITIESAFLTGILLLLIAGGVGTAQAFYYGPRIAARPGGDLSKVQQPIKPADIQRYREAIESTIDPMARWITFGIYVLAASFLISWRHGASLGQGIGIEVLTLILVDLVIAAGVLAVWLGAKAHVILAP